MTDTPDGQRRLVEPGGYVTVNSRGWFQPADQAARAADTGTETDHG